MNKVNPIPEGFTTVTPHIVVRGAAKAIEFYRAAFGAEELCRMPGPDGSIMHAELRIGNARVMLCDEFPEVARSPQSIGGSPVTLHLYVADVDAAAARAVKAGATVTMPIADQFWGDRYGKLRDPFGHSWSVATHIKDPTPEEMQAAMAEAFCGKP